MARGSDDATRKISFPRTIPVRQELATELEEVLEISRADRARRMPDAHQRFENPRQIGRGGMGAILQVFDRVMQREVALKRLHPGTLGVKQSLEEAQITGQLQHPNIVPVHDLGVDPRDGSVYFTMQLVEGRTLAEEVAEFHRVPFAPAGLSRLLSMVLDVCNALSYAHDRGVLHCDVKPSNIMVGSFGRVYLMDWGMSRVIAGDAARRLDPPIGGTAAFMAPEQAAADAGGVDERADVFGIGGLLYYILTGRGPAVSGPGASPLRDPETMGAWSGLPPRLCGIAAKALAIDPAARHGSISEIAGEVESFLSGGGSFGKRSFEAGDHLIREGEASDAAYLLDSGRCQVYRDRDGTREVLREIGPGEVVGEMALVSAGTRSANVVALEEGEARIITPDSLELELSSSWMRALVVALADRYRELDEERSRKEVGTKS